MNTSTLTSISLCDRCREEFPSEKVEPWLVRIERRPLLDPMPIAVGAPKYCRGCALLVLVQVQEIFGDLKVHYL